MPVTVTTDVSNYEAKGYGDLSRTMKALTWQGKDSVKLSQFSLHFILNISTYFDLPAKTIFIVETACPKIIDEGDVILKVTGSTICGSDLHLLHGMSWLEQLTNCC